MALKDGERSSAFPSWKSSTPNPQVHGFLSRTAGKSEDERVSLGPCRAGCHPVPREQSPWLPGSLLPLEAKG